jgi:hypothetical protein
MCTLTYIDYIKKSGAGFTPAPLLVSFGYNQPIASKKFYQ